MYHFLTTQFLPLIVTGVILSTLGGIWLLFAVHRSEVTLGRFAECLFPFLMHKVIRKHPGRCLPPLLLNLCGIILYGLGFLGVLLRVFGKA